MNNYVIAIIVIIVIIVVLSISSLIMYSTNTVTIINKTIYPEITPIESETSVSPIKPEISNLVSPNLVTLVYKGATGEELFDLSINNVLVKQNVLASKNPQTIMYELTDPTLNDLTIYFKNDGLTSEGLDNNIYISKLTYNNNNLLPMMTILNRPTDADKSIRKGVLPWNGYYIYIAN